MSDKPQAKSGQSMPAKRRKARHYALQALYQWQMAQQSLSDIEAQFRTDYDVDQTDLTFFQELVHEVPANLTELEAAFAPHLSDRKVDELDPIELSILRLGTYELAKRIDVPYKVAINESVSLAKKFGATDSHKYINGVLDKVARDLRAIEVKAAKRN